MLRWALSQAADSSALREFTRRSSISRRVVARYIAGESTDDGLRAARSLAEAGIDLTLDHVGEFIGHLGQADDAADVYRELLDHIGREKLPAGVSVKPTQLGLLLDREVCTSLIADLAKRAHDADVHVTLDMEDHTVTEATVELVEEAHAAGFTNVGCAVQAYLHRTAEDVRRLTATGASLRLCKGAYAEPNHLAYQRKGDVDRSYLESARYLIAEGVEPRFATHDHQLVAAIKREAALLGRDRDTYEFQMLYGVRPDMQRSLVADGYRLRVYLPFGAEWFSYFTRRLAERPANLIFFARALAGAAGSSSDDTAATP
jgi:proline dehydrogenase